MKIPGHLEVLKKGDFEKEKEARSEWNCYF